MGKDIKVKKPANSSLPQGRQYYLPPFHPHPTDFSVSPAYFSNHVAGQIG